MESTHDLRVTEFIPLMQPSELEKQLPMTAASHQTVVSGRQVIRRILRGEDRRMLVILGPCSIHDEVAAKEYAGRLVELANKVKDSLYLVMRVYFEKPRTNIGWKGLINDPYLNGSCDINHGLKIARSLLLQITAMGIPAGTEFLDPVTPQYIGDLVSWSSIGARTTESQTHREMASGLSMPVGFKNNTNGGLPTVINAMIAAQTPQSFLGIDHQGSTSIVKTTGNPYTHVVLRGGKRPNYDSVSVAEAVDKLADKSLRTNIVVDCSHANSRKKPMNQELVLQDIIRQRLSGNQAIIGFMLESHLYEGNQKIVDGLKGLKYGVSVTDACISWDTTQELLLQAHAMLSFF